MSRNSSVPIGKIAGEPAFVRDNVRAIGNGMLLFTADTDGTGYAGRYSRRYLRVSPAMPEVSCTTAYTDGALVMRFFGKTASCATDEEKAEVKATVYADLSSPVLIVSVSAMFDLFLSVTPEEGIRREYFERYSAALDERPCRKLIYREEPPVYAILDGDISYDSGEAVLHIKPGCSRIFLALLEEEDVFERLKMLLHSIPVPDIFASTPSDAVYQKAYLRCKQRSFGLRRLKCCETSLVGIVSFCRETVYSLQAKEGGFFCGSPASSLSDMCEIVRFLAADGNRESAEAFLGYADRLFQRYGELPYQCGADVSSPVLLRNVYNPAGDAFLFALSDCIRAFDPPFSEKWHRLASHIIEQDCRLVKGGMMPFSGAESCFSDGTLSLPQRFEGSSEATIRFLGAAKLYLSLANKQIGRAEERKLRNLVDFTEKSFFRNFAEDRKIRKNSPWRMFYIQYPHEITGYCDACRVFASLRYSAPAGYLCEKCYGQRTEPYDPEGRAAFLPEAVVLDRYVSAGIFSQDAVFERMDWRELSLDGLIMSVDYYRGKPALSRCVWNEVLQRITKIKEDGKDLPLVPLCRAAGAALRCTGRKTEDFGKEK